MMGLDSITSPQPFDKMPLVYERAFGGGDRTNPEPQKHVVETRNPVGVGYRHKTYGRFVNGRKLPNFEDPKHPIKSSKNTPPPAGFGFIGPEWEPRRKNAGTYDDNWMKNKMLLVPDDFDRRYYNAAHPDLVVQGYLKGNEPVEVVNASPRGTLSFDLPGIAPPKVLL